MWLPIILLTFFQPLVVSGSCQVDLDGDRQEERVVFRPKVDGAISVFRGRRKIWQGVPNRWQVWKLVIADVDGDGKKEFLLGVNIKTRYFPQRHKSVFVLGWNGKFAYARWLGSHLSKPLVDFVAAPLDEHQGDELVTLEVTRDGRHCIVVYRWIGFGFTVIWQSQPFAEARLFLQGCQVGVKLSDGQKLFIVNADGKWALKPYGQSVK
ncbi:MAG: FG-GAP repeat domain-containing protein [Armatimonadota bacterium]